MRYFKCSHAATIAFSCSNSSLHQLGKNVRQVELKTECLKPRNYSLYSNKNLGKLFFALVMIETSCLLLVISMCLFYACRSLSRVERSVTTLANK